MKSNGNKTSLVENELFDGYSEELLTFASAACILFIIIGIPGNLLTIIALSRGKTTRNATAIFIINLSFSDLLFGCFNLPLAASTFLSRAWNHGLLLCRLFPLMRYGLQAVSLFTISLITINRYIMIAHPRHYPRIYRHSYLALMVAGTWFLAFSFLITTWFGIWGIFGLDTTIGSCSILHDKNGRSPKEFFFVAAFLLPCICIVICYARIFYTVRKAALRLREIPEQKVDSPNSSKIVHNPIGKKDEGFANPSTADVKKPFVIDEDIEYIDMSDHSSCSEYCPEKSYQKENSSHLERAIVETLEPLKQDASKPSPNENLSRKNPIRTSLKTSFNKIIGKKNHYVSIGNTSNASSTYPGRMSPKDRRLLKMILTIFLTFVICYLPITVTKISKSVTDIHILNISGYLLIYLTTCINPLIYVFMSIEYRQAYRNLILCRIER